MNNQSELISQLFNYTWHKWDCKVHRVVAEVGKSMYVSFPIDYDDNKCTCGLQQLKQQLLKDNNDN